MRLALTLAILTASSLAFAKPKVAILGIEGDKDTAALAHDVTTALRDRVKASSDPYVLAPGSDKELADEKLMHNCQTEASACMAAIGADLGADILIFGRSERTRNGDRISLKLFDVAKKQAVRVYADVIGKDAKPAAWAKTAYGKLTE